MPRNRKLHGKRMKGGKNFGKVGSTNKLYHPSVPRTLQIATRRHSSQMLRFVKNMTFGVQPQQFAENIYLTIRANSIYDILSQNGGQNQPGTWNAQNNLAYGTGVNVVNAEGWNEWSPRFQHFTVMGSKCQVSFEPISVGYNAQGSSRFEPATLYCNLSGVSGAVTTTTACKDVISKPYTSRTQILASNARSGKRLYGFYSAKKFEGVKDVMDNSNLRGRLGTGAVPNEGSFFTVGIVPTVANALGAQPTNPLPNGIMRVKMEYIVKLSEPSLTNQVSA
ncbi:MAG: putative capsid protein [Circoviridae sp.]|nr:MAG: putative capsid protein [Circoviridae sp.]